MKETKELIAIIYKSIETAKLNSGFKKTGKNCHFE